MVQRIDVKTLSNPSTLLSWQHKMYPYINSVKTYNASNADYFKIIGADSFTIT